MTFSTRGSHFVKWVWLRYIANVLLTLRHNTFKRQCMTFDDVWRHASRDEIVQAFPSENTPTRNYNVTEHACVEEGEGLVSRLGIAAAVAL